MMTTMIIYWHFRRQYNVSEARLIIDRDRLVERELVCHFVSLSYVLSVEVKSLNFWSSVVGKMPVLLWRSPSAQGPQF